MVKVGDQIEVLKKFLDYAPVEAGDILTVSDIYDSSSIFNGLFAAEDQKGAGWLFVISGDNYKIVS